MKLKSHNSERVLLIDAMCSWNKRPVSIVMGTLVAQTSLPQ